MVDRVSKRARARRARPGVRMTVHAATQASVPAVALALQPIHAHASLRDQAYALLRQAIADADIYGHEKEIRLDERQLSQALGVSRTPVREAMTLLEREGFLRTVPRRGIFIVRKTKSEVVAMIQMWAALESMAARLATLHAPDGRIAALRRVFEGELSLSASPDRMDQYAEASIAFHQAIVNLGGSQTIANALRNLFIHVRAIRRRTLSMGDRAERSIADHLKIVEALERRETELAERLVREHTLDLAGFVEEQCEFLD